MGMGLFDAAKNGVDLASATIVGLSLIERMSFSDRPKDALAMIRVITLTLVEGYQGKLRGAQIQDALAKLQSDLHVADYIPSAAMIDTFKATL